MQAKLKIWTAVLLFSTLGISCSTHADFTSSIITLQLNGIEPLKNGSHYEGWAIVNGNPFSIGKFNVDDGEALIGLTGAKIPNHRFVIEADLSTATSFSITIEPDSTDDQKPSKTHVLAGELFLGSAELTIADNTALGSDFSSASGDYILGTPSDFSTDNDKSGIWFLDPQNGASLTLPLLPDGWRYEGWVIIDDDIPVSTGKFLFAEEPDNSSFYSDTNPTPPYPGEDFLHNAPDGLHFPIDLSGEIARISIEPEPDDDILTPYNLIVLEGEIPASAQTFTSFPLTNQSSQFPTGSVTIFH